MSRTVYVNGEYLPEEEAKISIFDRSFLMADGVYEVTSVLDGVASLEEGRRLVVEVRDDVSVDAAAGESLFFSSKSGCSICHSVEPGIQLVGPNLMNVATRAETRVPGLNAEEYLRRSIVDPDAYVVEGYPAGQMLDNFEETLSTGEIDSLVAFLLTLEG